MKAIEDNKAKFDPELATLPIMTAQWSTDPTDAVINYQNNILKRELGNWINQTVIKLFDKLNNGKGIDVMNQLVEEGKLALPGKLNELEIKIHSRLADSHIQITIIDNTEINRLRDIEQRSELINSFLMIGSHELKTPLNGIIGISSILKAEEECANKAEMFDLIINSGKALDNVVIKMLKHIYSYKSNNLISSIVILNIGETIISMSSLFNKYLHDRNFTINAKLLLDSQFVKFAEGDLKDILTEVAINLRRNTPPDGNVTISTFDQKNEVHLVIENECYGIPEDELEKVFEPFYRFQNKMQHSSGYEYNQAGAGMGLTILKRIVEKFNGKVWFENKYPYNSNKLNLLKLEIVFPAILKK
jgi:signal transduction histidine kinase